MPSQFVTNYSNATFLAPATDEDLIKTLLSGVSRLMEAQRRFADELDLSYERVFSYDFSPFVGKDIHDVLTRWAKVDKPKLNAFLPMIFEDLHVHQMALSSAMDSIARRALKYLAPEYTKGGAKTVNQTLNPVWKHYCKRHQRVSADPQLRHELLIAPGLARKYVRIRDKYFARKIKSQAERSK